jgi:Flp pilus assembly protein CpaB
MRGNRSLVIIAIVLIVVTVLAGGAYLYMQNLGGTPEEEVVETPEVAPVNTTEIVVALQSIPRGMEISVEDNAIALQEWPDENLPPVGEYFTSLEEIDGKHARMDIARGMPILRDMIGRPGGMLSVNGSAAALFEPGPENRVAYAIPVDTQGAVGWAIKPGDRVDVLAAINMIPVYTEFLEEGIRQFTYLQSGGEDADTVAQTSPYGRFELLPNGQWAAIYPVDSQPAVEPALIVQMTVQDAIVWHVGVWEEELGQVDSAPPPSDGGDGAAPLGGGGGAAETAPTPVPVQDTREIELVTLLVSREDALVLKYLYEVGADIDLALRPANVTGSVLETQPIWFRYILDRYNLPSTMPDDPVAPQPIRPPLEVLPEETPVPEE